MLPQIICWSSQYSSLNSVVSTAHRSFPLSTLLLKHMCLVKMMSFLPQSIIQTSERQNKRDLNKRGSTSTVLLYILQYQHPGV